MVRIPLGTTDQRRSLAQVPAVQVKNRFFESDPVNQKDQVALLARPGLRKWLEVGDGPIRGIYSQPGAFDEALFVVSGGNLYSIATDETITDLGALGTSTGSVSMAATDFPHKLYIADGNSLKLWDGATLTTVAVPDGDGIVSVGFIAQYVICVVAQGFDKNGRFYWIQPGETEIDPLDFATAERAPDPVWSVVVVGDQFWLPGTSTTEVWSPTGQAEAPFLRQQGRLFDKGVWEGTIIQVKDEVMAVGTDGNVYRIGAEPVKVGNASICQRLREAIGKQKKARGNSTPPAPATPLPVVSIAGPGSVAEGDSGSTAATFTLSRTGDLTRTSSVLVTVSGNGDNPAAASDFGGAFPSGTVSFAAGESSKAFVANISGDATVEVGEGFKAVLSEAVGCTIGTGTATGAIVNDDASGGGGGDPDPDPGATAESRDVIGAGGWVVRFAPPADDGTLMTGTDVYGAHVLAPGATRWEEQLVAGVTVDPDLVDPAYGDVGTYEVGIAPSDSDYRLVFTTGYMFRTSDGGETYTRSPMPQVMSGVGGNENGARSTGRCIAIDPVLPQRSFLILPTGVRYTDDHWDTWISISTGTLPAPTAGTRGMVAFDPSSAVVGGVTQGIYIFIPGSGLYRTTNGGTSWAAVSGTPRTNYASMKISASGRVFLAGSAGNNGEGVIGIYTGSAWVPGITKQAKTIAINPHNAGHVYAVMGGTALDCSTDDGVTWGMSGATGGYPGREAADIPWHLPTNESSLSNGDTWFDPLTNRMWLAEGIGCWYMDNPPTAIVNDYTSAGAFTGLSKGIENMVGQAVEFASDGTLGIACHDRGVFIIPKETPRPYPSIHGITMAPSLHHAQMCVPCPSNPEFWLASAFAVINPPAEATGWTSDRGASWDSTDSLKTLTSGPGGGVVAPLSETIWLQAQTNNGKDTGPVTLAGHTVRNGLYLTTDAGGSWEQIDIGDNIMQPHPVFYLANKSLFTDRFTPGRAWFINCGNLADNPSEPGSAESIGLWRIDVDLVTGTPTVTRVRSTFPAGFGPGYYRPKFAQVDANTFLYCGGDGELGLWRSTDGMATWNLITGTDDVGAGSQFAEVYGVAAGDGRLWAIGWRMDTPAHRTSADNDRHGLWYSDDGGATWTRYAQFPGGRWDFAQDLAADPTEAGRVALAYSGSGVLLIEQD